MARITRNLFGNQKLFKIMITDLSYESRYAAPVAGIDEAGRGPWAGPVVAAAVIFTSAQLPFPLNDSKQLTKLQREAIFKQLPFYSHIGIGLATVEEIDQLNILQATFLAMQRAFNNLPIIPACALVDGNQAPHLPCDTYKLIKGDSCCASIAAASIIAKVTRDHIMSQLSTEYPHYGWEKNAGYGTKLHQTGMSLYGISPHHRKSFKPVQGLLQNITESV